MVSKLTAWLIINIKHRLSVIENKMLVRILGPMKESECIMWIYNSRPTQREVIICILRQMLWVSSTWQRACSKICITIGGVDKSIQNIVRTRWEKRYLDSSSRKWKECMKVVQWQTLVNTVCFHKSREFITKVSDWRDSSLHQNLQKCNTLDDQPSMVAGQSTEAKHIVDFNESEEKGRTSEMDHQKNH
jgi:hypothetical protein